MVPFSQVAVPSRVDVETYQRLTSQVAQLIGTINGAFGSLSYSPVVYLYRSISAVELTALYTLGDVALITSLRDGMNLVASEFVACAREPCANRKAPGALVLSEFAGCAQSLAGAIRVNPWSPEDVAVSHRTIAYVRIRICEYIHSQLPCASQVRPILVLHCCGT